MDKLNLSTNSKTYWFHESSKHYAMYNSKKFIEYFLPFVNFSEEFTSKINIFSIQDSDEKMDKNSINVMISVENCNYWDHYKHIQKYGDFGNNNIQIYIYNHYDDYIETKDFIVIPVIYLQINYFLKYYPIITPTIFTPFENKKFCIQISVFRALDKNILQLIDSISKIGKIDHINLHFDEITNNSCYHSSKLLNLLNQYKFVICWENSFNKGYITEKIFNVLYSRSIPIYKGPNNCDKYFSEQSFININGDITDNITMIKELNDNENIYNKFIENRKIKKFSNNFITSSNIFFNNLKTYIIND